MSVMLQAVAGGAMAVAGWAIPRRVAGARRLSVATLLDAAPLATVFFILLVTSGRPIFAGAVVFALGAGFAFADRTMREVLREPVVFTVLSELPHVFTHPHLYLPFAGTGSVIGGAAAALLAGLALLIAEPAAMAPRPAAAAVAAGAIVVLLWQLGREPWLGAAARGLWRLRPSGEPFADAARLGPVGMLLVHGIIARAERPVRRARLAAPAVVSEPGSARPIVLVQCESFFDARRAFPGLPGDFLAGYDLACTGGSHGRLTVPAWGANTTRAEFAVLSGIDEAALGFDRFNPYHAFARAPLQSQVSRLRAAGHRTICLHPFDRGFFCRDVVLPALGFDVFLGRETLGGGRTPPYMSDPELAGHVLRVLGEAGPRVFIFAITMANHGPWPKGGEADSYLAGLGRSDEMLQVLVDGLSRRHPDALLGFYGDHLPSLPHVFDRLGFDDWRSDYAIWSADGVARRRDLAAHELGRELVDLAVAPRNSAALDAVVAEAPDA